jgi:hypothetical protein
MNPDGNPSTAEECQAAGQYSSQGFKCIYSRPGVAHPVPDKVEVANLYLKYIFNDVTSDDFPYYVPVYSSSSRRRRSRSSRTELVQRLKG